MAIVTFYNCDPKDAPKTTMPAHLGSNAILTWDGKLLLEKRRDSDVWGLVGGGVKNWEAEPQAMAREVYEELGIRIPKENFQKNLEYYTKILHCEEFLNQRVSTLSLGQKLRAELLCILIYEPKLLVLDEPTLGLDIERKRQFREVLRNLVQNKKISVIITTHDINDMEKLCSRFLMICHGEKVLDLSNYEFE